jgi:hypothetical protein
MRKSSRVNRQALSHRAGKMSEQFRSGRLDGKAWLDALSVEATRFADSDWQFAIDKCLTAANNQIRDDAAWEARMLQVGADAKATAGETWQALHKEGEEAGDQAAANGHASVAEALEFDPWYQGFLRGFADHIDALALPPNPPDERVSEPRVD